MLETPLGERSERSERSDQDGLGELPSENRSNDTVRVREGHLRKAIQHVSPRGFILNALPVLLLTPGFKKYLFFITFSTIFAFPWGAKLASLFNEVVENVERGARRTRQTAATDVLILSKLLWLEFGASEAVLARRFRGFLLCCLMIFQ